MKKEKWPYLRGLICTVAVFAALLLAACSLVDQVDATSDEAQLQLVEDAVRSALVTCYATEGSYPSDIAHLKEHYGLAYDEDRFFVTYDAFAANILPSIWVTAAGTGVQ